MTTVIDAILKRSSEPRLQEPAPSPDVLEQAFHCAARAPDHALLRPWRYLVIEGKGLESLGKLFAATADQGSTTLEQDREKLQRMPQRAPMVIVGIVSPRPHPKVPQVEQEMSAAVGMGYLLLALQSAGYGGIWRTGEIARDRRVSEGLGLADHESIAGFLYVGSVVSEKPEVPRPELESFVARWPADDAG